MNIEQFIDEYYNRCRLHSALGYRPPEEFERLSAAGHVSNQLDGATIRFFHHAEGAGAKRLGDLQGRVLDGARIVASQV